MYVKRDHSAVGRVALSVGKQFIHGAMCICLSPGLLVERCWSLLRTQIIYNLKIFFIFFVANLGKHHYDFAVKLIINTFRAYKVLSLCTFVLIVVFNGHKLKILKTSTAIDIETQRKSVSFFAWFGRWEAETWTSVRRQAIDCIREWNWGFYFSSLFIRGIENIFQSLRWILEKWTGD